MLNKIYERVARDTANKVISNIANSKKENKSNVKDFINNPDEFILTLSVSKQSGDININIRRNPEWLSKYKDIHLSRR